MISTDCCTCRLEYWDQTIVIRGNALGPNDVVRQPDTTTTAAKVVSTPSYCS
jgi:hypothetical protein